MKTVSLAKTTSVTVTHSATTKTTAHGIYLSAVKPMTAGSTASTKMSCVMQHLGMTIPAKMIRSAPKVIPVRYSAQPAFKSVIQMEPVMRATGVTPSSGAASQKAKRLIRSHAPLTEHAHKPAKSALLTASADKAVIPMMHAAKKNSVT